MKTLLFIGALVISSFASANYDTSEPGAIAHSGGTDRWGCHVDSRTGIRHCH